MKEYSDAEIFLHQKTSWGDKNIYGYIYLYVLQLIDMPTYAYSDAEVFFSIKRGHRVTKISIGDYWRLLLAQMYQRNCIK